MFKLIISLKCCMMFYLRMKILWMEGIENFPNIDFFYRDREIKMLRNWFRN